MHRQQGRHPETRREIPGLSIREHTLIAEFDDLRHEWRRLFCEAFGTCLLVMTAAGPGVVDAVSPGSVNHGAAVVAPGLLVMSVILFCGAVSGAHLNPVVSVAFALRGDFHWRRVPGYVCAQLLGAAAGAGLLRLILGAHGSAGMTLPGAGFSLWQALGIEVVLTCGLVSTILGAASGAQSVGSLAAVASGAYISLAGLWGSPVSGASMNPARSFGPALICGNFDAFWIYVAGPLLGAILAVGIAEILRGPGGDRISRRAAQGDGD